MLLPRHYVRAVSVPEGWKLTVEKTNQSAGGTGYKLRVVFDPDHPANQTPLKKVELLKIRLKRLRRTRASCGCSQISDEEFEELYEAAVPGLAKVFLRNPGMRPAPLVACTLRQDPPEPVTEDDTEDFAKIAALVLAVRV